MTTVMMAVAAVAAMTEAEMMTRVMIPSTDARLRRPTTDVAMLTKSL
jgi:hypothetical protein